MLFEILANGRAGQIGLSDLPGCELGWIHSLMVEAGHQRRGIAYKAMIRLVMGQEHSGYLLYVRSKNFACQGLIKKLGGYRLNQDKNIWIWYPNREDLKAMDTGIILLNRLNEDEGRIK